MLKEHVILDIVDHTRTDMAKIGGRKLYSMINQYLGGELQIGRDAFFDLLRRNNRLVRCKRRNVRTTYSNHWLRKYPNLIKSFIPTAPQPNMGQ